MVFATSTLLIILLFSVFHVGDDESIVGFADDIDEKGSGFVFYIVDDDGNRTKGYSTFEIDGGLHTFHGSFSKDRNIFFVSSVS